VRRIELGDFLIIAEIHTGIDAHVLARDPRVAAQIVTEVDFIAWVAERIGHP
jgi:hypothetical protein